MKNIVLSSLTFFLLVHAVGSSLSAQEKYTLKTAYPPGQYELVINTDMDMTVEVSGVKMPSLQTQTQYLAIDAAPKNADGTQKVVMEVTRVTMTQKMGALDIKYDSAAPDADQSPMKAAGALVGMKCTISFDKDGQPVKYEGMDDFFKKLLESPDYPNEVVAMLKEQLTDEAMAQSFDLGRNIVPEVPVSVGETWKTEGSTEVPILGRAKTSVENTLKEVKTENGRKIAVILSKLTNRSEEPKEMSVQGVNMTITKMDVNVDTTTLLDIESGLVKISTANTVMAIEMDMKAGGQSMTQKITGTGTTTSTVTPKQSR